MGVFFRVGLFTLACAIVGARSLSASPVTLRATGQISSLFAQGSDGTLVLPGIHVGDSWTLEFTYDSDAFGRQLGGASSPNTYLYSNAILAGATLQLGDFSYTNTFSQDIYTNADLPLFGYESGIGRPGLVQFEFQKGWTLPTFGGPNLNGPHQNALGLLLLGYNDLGALDGSLPDVLNRAPYGSALNGIEWDDALGGRHAQFSGPSDFEQLDPVPEPATLLLLSSGLLAAAHRRYKRRSVARPGSSRRRAP